MSLDTQPQPVVSEGDSSISSIDQIQAIEKSRNQLITKREDVAKYVESPLLAACLDLWDKNIRTLATSANAKDVGTGRAYILVDYPTLSDFNKQVAQEQGEIFEYDGSSAVSLDLPVARSTSVEDLSTKAVDVTRLFKKQKPRWIPAYTLEELYQIYRIDPNEHKYDAPENWTQEGWYYDAASGKYFFSQEHFQKTLEEIEE